MGESGKISGGIKTLISNDGLVHTTKPPPEGDHNEAYYLYFVSSIGVILNFLIIFFIIWRKSLRRMTCAFLIHHCVLNIIKCAFAIFFAQSLLLQLIPDQTTCDRIGEVYVIVVTASAFNLIALICSEAYTFEEMNVGGNYRGSPNCVLFGVIMIYFGCFILHLGPTIISGYFKFHEKIGICSFELGEIKSYVANVMWIVIITMALAATTYYITVLYKEIQVNKPNRVSMLVRSSVCLAESPLNERGVKLLVQDSYHRVKLLIATVIMFGVCWYPLFSLLLIDIYYQVPPQVYQTLSFIAWSHSTFEPVIYVVFDKHLYLLSRLVYCHQHQFTHFDGFAPLIRRRQKAREDREFGDSNDVSINVREATPEGDTNGGHIRTENYTDLTVTTRPFSRHSAV